ncbi:MAG: hypothetical protein AABX99_03525 [Nanoarchaeota archaeon]
MHNYTIKDRVNLFLDEVVRNVCINDFEGAKEFLNNPKERYLLTSKDSGLTEALNPDKQTENIDYILGVVQENIAFANWCKKNKIPIIRDKENRISWKTTDIIKDDLGITSFAYRMTLGFYIQYLNQL